MGYFSFQSNERRYPVSKRNSKTTITLNCPLCGSEKTTSRVNAVYCGRKCKSRAETIRRNRMQFHIDHLEDQGFEPQAQWGYATPRSHEDASRIVTYRQESTINWDED